MIIAALVVSVIVNVILLVGAAGLSAELRTNRQHQGWLMQLVRNANMTLADRVLDDLKREEAGR